MKIKHFEENHGKTLYKCRKQSAIRTSVMGCCLKELFATQHLTTISNESFPPLCVHEKWHQVHANISRTEAANSSGFLVVFQV